MITRLKYGILIKESVSLLVSSVTIKIQLSVAVHHLSLNFLTPSVPEPYLTALKMAMLRWDIMTVL